MGWKRCCLKINNLAVKFLAIFNFWMECFYLFWVSMLHDASIRFLFKRIYRLEEDVWKIPRRLFSAWPSLVSEWNERSISKSQFGLTNPIKFLLIWTYGLEEEVVWRISIWLLSGWTSLISEWNDLSNSGSPFCLEDSYQFSAQEKIWVWRCCLKNFKMAV